MVSFVSSLAHSFIIDPDDETYIQNDVPKMPTDLLKYLGSFRKKTTEDLRIVLEA
jgi:hypothetical protein